MATAIAIAIAPPANAQGAWRDSAPHSAHFVRVEPGVRLHYLDFGGTGPALVFLAGLGNTAHAFDAFAPAFTDRFHVIAITRRGFGESDHPAAGYDIDRLTADILAVLDSLKLSKVSIVGHSIAGEEMTHLAVAHPSRVDKLVFLDAAYDRVRAEELVTRDSAPDMKNPVVPAPRRADTATAAGYVAYVHRSRGVDIPEADIRTRYRYDGWREEITPAYQAISVERPDYRRLLAPSLAIYAVHDDDDALASMLRSEFRSETLHNAVLEIHGAHHWIFVSHRAQVLAATREFLAR